ncbi:MAG: TIR domain-containing protein [Candidatus Margulisiibacteriota bacterium]
MIGNNSNPQNSLLSYLGGLKPIKGLGLEGSVLAPLGLSVRRKVFISFYHREDQYYKDRFESLFGHLFINKSVQNGDINTDVSTEYIKRLIQGPDFLLDASVLVVLCGPNTWGRKHVDWEISGALNKKLDGYSGILGLTLPSHPDFLLSEIARQSIPPRLAENIESGYAKQYRWTEDPTEMSKRIEEAFSNRKNSGLIKNSLPQMQRNRSTMKKSLAEVLYGETSGYE